MPLPKDRLPPVSRRTVPAAVKLRGPVSGLAPVKTNVPAPAFARPAVPASRAPTVAVAFVPSTLTVIVGRVPAIVRVLALLLLLSSTQLAGLVGSVSPKIRLLTVRAESRWTVLSLGRSSVLKFALWVLASGIIAPCQLVASLQRPPALGLIQVPLPGTEMTRE